MVCTRPCVGLAEPYRNTSSCRLQELHKLWLHKLEDDGNADDSSEDEDDDPGIQVVRLPNIKLTVKCNSLRSR